MTLPRAPAHVVAAALCVGLALANATRVHDGCLICSFLAASSVAIVADPPRRRLAVAVVLALGLGWWWASTRLDALDRSPMTAEIGRAGRAVVVVTAPPREGRFDIRAQGAIRSFDGRRVREPVQLELPVGRSPPQGALLSVLAVVAAPKGPAADGFDERTYLRRHGIHVVLRVDAWHRVGRRGGLGGVADRLHLGLAASIAPGLAGERRAVLEGIVLGDDAALSEDLRQDFQASGLYHILAVSGQNVVLVAAGALGLAWLLGISRLVGELGALACITGYVLAVGPQPSVIRAGIAGSLASLAWLSGRLQDAWHALFLAAIVLLAWNPYTLFDAGFQLSFTAVAAIFTVAPRLGRSLDRLPLPRSVRTGIGVSTACGLLTAPILWLQFGYLPVLSVPANALAEPAMPILLGLAFVTAGLDLVSPPAAAFVASLDGWVAAYIAFCARLFGSLPFAEVQTDRGLAAAAGVLLVAAYAWWRWQTSSSRPT
jgi:competence protein ComEC